MVSQRYVLRRQTLTRSGVGGNSEIHNVQQTLILTRSGVGGNSEIRNERQTLTRSGAGGNSEIRNVQQTLILTRSGVGDNSEIRNVLERVSTRVVVVVVAQPDCLPTLVCVPHTTLLTTLRQSPFYAHTSSVPAPSWFR